jgi:hypothetical protein
VDAGSCYSTETPWCVDSPDCSLCTGAQTCLSTLTEGQTTSYCAEPCVTDSSCPSGFFCDDVVNTCCQSLLEDCAPFEGQQSGCPPDSYCHGWEVVDEVGLVYLCTAYGDGGQPVVIEHDCSPVTGFCDSASSGN